MSKHTWIGWYNITMKYSWRIVGSHLFFLLAAGAICYGTYRILMALPAGQDTVATKAAVVQTGAVVLGLFSIVLTALQVRVNATWNKVLSYHNHFGSLITPEVIEKVKKVAIDRGFTDHLTEGTTIPETIAAAILENADSESLIGCYLDEFEEFCGAINAGVVDNDYAYGLEGTRILRVWNIYKLFIKKCRESDGSSPYVYKQLEVVAHRWADRRQYDNKKEAARQQKLNGRGGMGSTV